MQATADIKELVLSNGSFGPREIGELTRMIAEDFNQFHFLREAVGELEGQEGTPATAVRLGVCYYILGRYPRAVETLTNADGGALAHFYLGKSQVALAKYEQAIASFQKAKTGGYSADDCEVAIAEAQRLSGQPIKALQTLDALSGAIEQTGEYLYQRGFTVNVLGGNPTEVIALYERAVEVEPTHQGALFGLAMENDRRGNDETAMNLYQRSVARFPANLGSLLNLGILYEDRNQYDRAQFCYHRILEVFPDDPRARLFLKDAAASSEMYYDADAERRSDRLSHVLNIPVADFELSVRSRNCLQKMGVRTLGDLTRTTEGELLASKNFGETSLVEIRDMLHSKGLELGQFAHERTRMEPAFEPSLVSPDEQALLDRPIAELNLSVRARKCMVRLGISTIGELVRKTADDLLECKNFGVTSLTEVREKLVTLNIKLRGE